MLLLIALTALMPVYVVSTQDVSRLCLTRALADGRLTISRCARHTLDQARYAGHAYSDKAPGLSILAIPAAELTGLPGDSRSEFHHDLGVWAVRVLTNGVAFLLVAFVLGRVAEGVAENTGGPVAVAFALGTISSSLAATMFDQVSAAAFCFGSFVLAWRQRPGFAGVLAGVAFVVEYQSALILVILALYVAATGARRLGRFLLGVTPPLVILAAYDWTAFGSPLHLSYRYVANRYATAQATGLFGISWPRWHAVTAVLVGDRGLLITSPLVLLAPAGVLLLSRSHRREAVVCGAVTAVALLLEFGYFLPYGGISPGPRFLVPALPFLVLSVAPVFLRARTVASTLLVASVVACTAILVTWPNEGSGGYRQTVWGEIARAVTGARSPLRAHLTTTLLRWVGVGHGGAAAVVALCAGAAAAFALTVRPAAGMRARTVQRGSS